MTTLCGPGEPIDVAVTERGIAINPRRAELIEALRGSALPLRSLAELKAEAETICGGAPQPLDLAEETVGVVTWVDGTVLDRVQRVKG